MFVTFFKSFHRYLSIDIDELMFAFAILIKTKKSLQCLELLIAGTDISHCVLHCSGMVLISLSSMNIGFTVFCTAKNFCRIT